MPEQSDRENFPTNRQSTPNLPLLEDARYRSSDIISPEELINQTAVFMKEFGEQIETGTAPDTVFFLLKSALPVARMFKIIWPKLYPDSSMPRIRYVNIGRNKPSEEVIHYNFKTRGFTMDKIDPDINLPSPEILREKFEKSILPGEKALLVDEWSESGLTIEAAKELFSKTFPNVHFDTRVVYDKIPHWFGESSYLGVEDATEWDNVERAIEKVNRKFGTDFRSEQEMMGDERVTLIRRSFLQYLDEYNASPFGVIGTADVNLDIATGAKSEINTICKEVVDRIRKD